MKKAKRHIRSFVVARLFKQCGKGFIVGDGGDFHGCKNIIIGDKFSAGNNTSLQTWEIYRGENTGYNPEIIIGNNVRMMNNCQISCLNRVVIGNDVLFGDNVFITDNMHGSISRQEMLLAPIERALYSKGEVKVGNKVWVGRNVCILPNVTVGKGAIIGANSVVTHDVPNFSVVAGIPAQVIKQL